MDKLYKYIWVLLGLVLLIGSVPKAYGAPNLLLWDGEELFLESVNLVRAEGEEVVLRNLFGEVKRVRGVLKEVSLTKNRVIVEQA